MRNARTAVAAVVVVGSALAWQVGLAPSGASVPVPQPPSPAAAVVRANAQVDDAIVALRAADGRVPITIVRVVGEPSQVLLQDARFLANVHALQDFLNNNDAGVLNGAGVSITEVLAIEFGPDGGVALFTR